MAAAPQPPMRSKSDLHQAIRTTRRAVLVVNTRARRGRRYHAAILARLRADGWNLVADLGVDRPGGLADTIAAAVDHRPDVLIAAGGDGTISEAARQLAHRDIALGLLPLGTTNNFARTLTVPLTVAGALDTLVHGVVADVDLGHVNGRVFTNMVSLGVSARVAEHAPHRLKRILGRAAYPLTAAAILPRHHPFRARLTTDDGRTVSAHTHQLNIANGGFHAGNPITADASPDDRLLTTWPLGGPRRTSLVAAIAGQVAHGRRRTQASHPFLTTDALTLHTDPPQALDIDGELHGSTPARITLSANALRVLVPVGFPDT
ncbi:diacylglycerol/lipid kinase family protein [Actinocatenispora rupis]|uniref:Diacylglycerol kinase n=1 Tax=Actinocatenispora rupis TaxID=519421 RepID=A0A8J3J4J4_9ACTN|nr:YegS/Rv2252/BmrU family lipid kinase [Actinocatenispora rupis]GID14565.1 diacylglycerol kinase [Actinocatenispora rupis]